MENNREYRIYIHNVVDEKQEESSTNVPTPKQAQEVAKKTEKSAALIIGQQIGQQAFNFALSNFGDLTGDYTTQKLLQFGLGAAGDIASIVIAGVATGGTGAIVAGAGVALKYAVQGANYGLDILKQQQNINIMKERLGNVAVGGNRR